MKKILITLLLFITATLSLNANDVKNIITLQDNNLTEVVVNIPSTIKVFISEDDNSYFRIRTRQHYLLNNINYNYQNNQLLFSTYNGNINNINSNDIIIYLYVKKNDIKYITQNHDLVVDEIKLHHSTDKNTKTPNHENKD